MTGAGEPLSPTLNPSRPNGPHSSSLTGLVPGSAAGDGNHREALKARSAGCRARAVGD